MPRKSHSDLRSDSKIKRPKRNQRAEFRDIVVSFLRARDGDACQICGEHMPFDEMSIDHIVEVWRGGKNEHDNVRLVHLGCNLSRPRGKYAHVSRVQAKCKKGHDLTNTDNVYVRPDGERNCRVCRNAGNRRRRSCA